LPNGGRSVQNQFTMDTTVKNLAASHPVPWPLGDSLKGLPGNKYSESTWGGKSREVSETALSLASNCWLY
jgi:hypothetical protein